MMEITPIIEVKELTICKGTVPLLDNVGLKIERGDRWGILGESGAGKSLLVSALLRLVPQSLSTSGQILWKGEPIDAKIKNLRGRSIAYIPQDPLEACFPAYTLGRQWKDFYKAHHREFNEGEICELLETAGINNPVRVLSSYPHQLSGGQLQRVLIAMAISGQPEVLIADEPTTALDLVTQRQVLALINQFCESRNITLLYITHDLFVIPALCRKAVVLDQGKVVETANASDLPKLTGQSPAGKLVASFRKLLEKPEIQELSTSGFPFIEAKNFSFTYSGARFFWQRGNITQAVLNASIKVLPGQITGLSGPSGAGKTTLLRGLAGLLPLHHHLVAYKGKALSTLTEMEFRAFRAKVQVIYQNPASSLNPLQPAREVLREALSLTPHETKLTVNDLLDRVRLPARVLSAYASQMSGGEKQRLCIARALALSPEVLLCDEPTSSLDPSVRAEILDLFLSLKKELNLGILLVSHNLVAIRHTCDTVAVMAEGEIKETGPAEKVFLSPTTNHTLQLIEAEPALTHHFL